MEKVEGEIKQAEALKKDDYKDRRGLEDRLISEINALAQKYFRIIDFIK